MKSFRSPWTRATVGDGRLVWRPTVAMRIPPLPEIRYFIVDSGADISLGPRWIADRLGIDWSRGEHRTLRGISAREECSVEARLHHLDLEFVATGDRVRTPIALAEGEAPELLGRFGVFQKFAIRFDEASRTTEFHSR